MSIFFWTGEETFLIDEKKQKWIKAFSEKYNGDMNISVLDGQELTAGEITSDLESMPFLAEKRLIFIKNLPPKVGDKIDDKKSDNILATLENIDETFVVVFIEANPDKRTSFYKKFIKHAEIEEFKPLSDYEIKKWIHKNAQEKGGSFLPSALEFFVEYVGNNLWQINNEIDKLIAYKGKEKAISENDIEKLIIPDVSFNIFQLIDAISEKNKKKALKEFNNILKKGESLIQVLFTIIGQIRTLILAKEFPKVDKNILIKELKLHPFVASKIFKFVNNFSSEELQKIYKKLLDIDIGIKTGGIIISNKNEKALALALETMILKL